MRSYLASTAAAVLQADTSTITAAPGPGRDVDPEDLPPNLDAWPPRATWDQAVARHLLPAGEQVWRTAWSRELSDTDADTGSAYLDQYLAETTDRLNSAAWPDDVYDTVRATVAESIELGENLGDLRARIAELLQLDRWAYRAKFIARNESLAALNAGGYAAGLRRTQMFEEVLYKKWLAVPDTSTRLAHRDVDGTVVPANATFDVGGEQLRYPHDPHGSLSQTANCRCLLLWVDEHEAAADLDGPLAAASVAIAPSTAGKGAAVGETDMWELPTDAEVAAWREAGIDPDCPADEPAAGDTATVTPVTDTTDVTPVTDTTVTAAADFTPSGGPTAAKRRRAEKAGHALPGGRYPIENSSDLAKAIDAVGRAKGGAAGRNAVRRHIIRQARRLGLSQKIPATWNADGTLKPTSGTKTTPRAMAASPNQGSSRLAAAPTTAWVEQVAANVPMEPHKEAFETPPMARGTKMHVLNDDGWVAGYIADWDSRHRVYDVPPPRDPYGGTYPKFHRHPVRTSDGTRVMTGPIATNGHGNNPADGQLPTDMWQVIRHYDDPRFVAADVVVTETDHGIWASGALRAGVSPFQVALLDTYSQSGHWMNEELVASCCVSVPAFELTPAQLAASLAAASGIDPAVLQVPEQTAVLDDDGNFVALVAAGILPVDPPTTTPVATVDPWALLRGLRAAERVDNEITAACKRMTTDPAVEEAATRVRAGRN